MPDYGTNKKLVSKEVNYLGRDFTDIRNNLIEFAKNYFPNQYNDFNEASPGMMFVEMASLPTLPMGASSVAVVLLRSAFGLRCN